MPRTGRNRQNGYMSDDLLLGVHTRLYVKGLVLRSLTVTGG
jgi:hypothetical protein